MDSVNTPLKFEHLICWLQREQDYITTRDNKDNEDWLEQDSIESQKASAQSDCSGYSITAWDAQGVMHQRVPNIQAM